ncbi:MAG: hypothetical protein ACETVN_00900 [Asgard group archaeon]
MAEMRKDLIAVGGFLFILGLGCFIQQYAGTQYPELFTAHPWFVGLGLFFFLTGSALIIIGMLNIHFRKQTTPTTWKTHPSTLTDKTTAKYNYCPYCANPLLQDPDAKYCQECGEPV